jgi:hypothetical protein
MIKPEISWLYLAGTVLILIGTCGSALLFMVCE